MPCLRRTLKRPFKDYLENAVLDTSGNFMESPGYFYDIDGYRRLKKGHPMIDRARRWVMQSDDRAERSYWMKVWGLS